MWRFGSTKHGACCNVRLRGWAAARRAHVPGIGGLTSHSSRCRFAARLNSGVRPCFPHCWRDGSWSARSLRSSAGFGASHAQERHRRSLVTHLGFGQAKLRLKYDHPESVSGGLAVRVLGRAVRAIRLRPRQVPAQAVGPDLLYCSARGWVASPCRCRASAA